MTSLHSLIQIILTLNSSNSKQGGKQFSFFGYQKSFRAGVNTVFSLPLPHKSTPIACAPTSELRQEARPKTRQSW